MSAARDEIIQLFINKFASIQLEPGRRTYKSYLLFLFILASHANQVFFGAMLVAKSNKFLIMATGVKTVIVNFQLVKILAAWRQNDILDLFESHKIFWDDESTERIYKIALRGTKAFQYVMYASYATIIVLPNFLGHLAFDVYLNFPGAFWMHSILQIVQFWYAMEIVIVVDCLFLCLSFFVSGQFRLLHKRLENLGKVEHNMYEEARQCVKHHVFLLKYIERYAHMFQYPLLSQYCVTTASLCVEAFVITKASMAGVVQSCIYLFILLFQLALYCFPADRVIQDALNTNQAIFNCNWYSHRHFANTFVQNIMVQSQRVVVFSAGGFMDINRASFTNIFKWTMSFYAMMRDFARILD